MARMATYDEVLEFRMKGGFRVLMPSEADLALAAAAVERTESAFTQLKDEPAPPDVAEARELVKAARTAAGEDQPGEAEVSAAVARIEAWNDGRSARWQTARLALQAAADSLEVLQRTTASVQAESDPEVYVFRYISHEEAVEAYAEFPVAEGEDGVRNREKRNAKLLQATLQGVRENGEVAPVEKVTLLPPVVFRTLVGRMWLRNEMSAELIAYFREPGRAAGSSVLERSAGPD